MAFVFPFGVLSCEVGVSLGAAVARLVAMGGGGATAKLTSLLEAEPLPMEKVTRGPGTKGEFETDRTGGKFLTRFSGFGVRKMDLGASSSVLVICALGGFFAALFKGDVV